jgi:hypothetical protein
MLVGLGRERGLKTLGVLGLFCLFVLETEARKYLSDLQGYICI